MGSAALDSGAATIEFRGHAGRFVGRTGLYLAALATVCSIVLMGDRWLRFALLSWALFAPALALLYWGLRRLDRFTLDDQAGGIRMPGRGLAAYGDLDGVRLHQTAGISSWSVGVSSRTRRLLIAGSPALDAAIRAALEARVPAAVFRESSTTAIWLWVGLLLMPVAMQESFLYWLRGQQPQTVVSCSNEAWTLSDGVGATAIGGFTVSPPPGYRPLADEPGAYGGEDGTELQYAAPKFAADMSAAQLWVLRLGVGVDSPAKALEWAGCAQRGVLPLAAKAALYTGGRDRVAVFEGGAALLRGHSALVAIESRGGALTVNIRAPEAVSNDLVASVVASVNVKRPGEP